MNETSGSMFKPVYWHEGLFLQPQHLQQQDLYTRSYTYELHQLRSRYFWGVIGLKFNIHALKNGVIELQSYDLLFRDGTRLMSSCNIAVPVRNLHAGENKKAVSIYLGLRRAVIGGNNIDLENEEAMTVYNINNTPRYLVRSDPVDTHDLYQENKTTPVKYIDHPLAVILGSEINDAKSRYETIKVAEIVCGETGCVLSDEFYPPAIFLESVAGLKIRLSEILESIVFKLGGINESCTSGGLKKGMYTDYRMQRQWSLLCLLNRFSASLSLMLESRHATPESAFLLLKHFQAELAPYAGAGILLCASRESWFTQKYEHTGLYSCFDVLLAQLDDMLGKVMFDSTVSITLKYNGKYYSSTLDPEILNNGSAFYLKLEYQADLHDPEAMDAHIESFMNTAKISSLSHIDKLLLHFIPGVNCHYEKFEDHRLDNTRHSWYFRLNNADEHWSNIVNDESVALFSEELPGDVSVALVVKSEHES